jgi:hypothetical protein
VILLPFRIPRPAVHRTIVVVDVEKFGDRANRHQVAARAGLYRALEHSFQQARIRWAKCYREDRGDGVVVLAPAEIAKGLFVDSLPLALAAALREHNRTHRREERIRLRMAVHAGEINYDEHGVTATAITLAFRLVNSDAVRMELAGSPGVLALVASSWFYDEVVRNSAAGAVERYRPVPVEVKETSTVGWVCLPDQRSRALTGYADAVS